MTKLGWLFPGQASQKVGMGLDLYNETELGKEYFDTAQEILNCDIKSIVFQGPEEKLKLTMNNKDKMIFSFILILYE